MNKPIPYTPTHPGELLKDELQARNITQRRFAEATGISYTMLNDIVNCRRPVTTDVALLIEAALGTSADIFVNLQTRYNLLTARKDTQNMKRLEAVRKICASLL